MLNLWWGITEQTYLYYWHHKVWAVLAAWTVLILFLILLVLIGQELWRAGYRAALRPVSTVNISPLQSSPPVQRSSPENRRFLAPPSQAFPAIRGFFSRQEGRQDQGSD